MEKSIKGLLLVTILLMVLTLSTEGGRDVPVKEADTDGPAHTMIFGGWGGWGRGWGFPWGWGRFGGFPWGGWGGLGNIFNFIPWLGGRSSFGGYPWFGNSVGYGSGYGGGSPYTWQKGDQGNGIKGDSTKDNANKGDSTKGNANKDNPPKGDDKYGSKSP